MKRLSYARVVVGLFVITCHVPITTGPLGPLPNQVPSKEPVVEVPSVPETAAAVEAVAKETTVGIPTAVPMPTPASTSVAAVKVAIKEECRPVSRYFKDKPVWGYSSGRSR